jgi:hypothetical protein
MQRGGSHHTLYTLLHTITERDAARAHVARDPRFALTICRATRIVVFGVAASLATDGAPDLQPGHSRKDHTQVNWDQIQANWGLFRRRIKQRWHLFTDAQLDAVGGKRVLLVHGIGELYQLSAQESDRQLTDWQARQQMAPA